MSTYNASIPQPTDLISVSQAQILGNFSQLNTQFAQDHVAFNTGSGNGDGTHKQVTFDNAPTAPSPSGNVSVIAPQTVNSIQELTFTNSSTEYNGTGSTQITGPSLLVGGSNTDGYAFLPGGLLMKWGNFTATGKVIHTFPTSASIPVFNNVFGAWVNNLDGSSTPNSYATLQGFSTTNITVYGSSRTGTGQVGIVAYYIVIGN